jgi:hypothetical protein
MVRVFCVRIDFPIKTQKQNVAITSAQEDIAEKHVYSYLS